MLPKILAKTLPRAVLGAAFAATLAIGLLSSIGAASATEDCPWLSQRWILRLVYSADNLADRYYG